MRKEDRTNIFISSSDHYEFLYDKYGLIAEKSERQINRYWELKKRLARIGFFPYSDGKDKGIMKKEKYYDIKVSYNKDQKKIKIRFLFKTGINFFKMENIARNFILNVLREPMENWEIKQYGELTLDFKDFNPEYIHNLDKVLNFLHQEDQEYVKRVYIDNQEVKLYLKRDKRVRLEVIFGKEDSIQNTFEIMTKVLNTKKELQLTEKRNEIYFQRLIPAIIELKENVRITGVKFVELMGELREDQITAIYQLDQIQNQQTQAFQELSDRSLDLIRNMGKLGEIQEGMTDSFSQLMQQLVSNQTLMIQILNEKFEGMFHQNKEIQDNQDRIFTETKLINHKLNKIEQKGIFKKLKRFFKRLFSR